MGVLTVRVVTIRRLLAFAVAVVITTAAVSCGGTREGGVPPDRTSRTEGRGQVTDRPAVASARFVFLAPFDAEEAAYSAQWQSLDVAYGPVNYVVTRTACRPSEPARDRFDRRGWSRVDCTISIAAQAGDKCVIEYWDERYKTWDEGTGKCTGTIWQITDGDDAHFITDTKARRARFHVMLHLNQGTGYVSARIWQLPPFAPRLSKMWE